MTLVDAMEAHLTNLGIPFMREFRFHPKRRWRFDFYVPDHNFAIEIEGGVWTKGRHTRGTGYIVDCDKYNNATLMGFKVLRFTASHMTKTRIHETLSMIQAACGRLDLTDIQNGFL
jgi:very-short-patch-repair endonuclease